MTGQFSGDLKPDLVIPFKLDKEAAKKALLQHMEGKPLLPKIFKSENHIDEIKGIYVPVWLFNAEADAQFRYEAKKIRRWTDQQFSYTETSVFHVDRAGTISFENVPVDGSSKMDNTLMESLEPFDCKVINPSVYVKSTDKSSSRFRRRKKSQLGGIRVEFMDMNLQEELRGE